MATKNKKKLTRTQKKVEEIKEELNIQEENVLTKDDYAAMAIQCEKFKNACSVGTVGSCITKFAVYYKKQWFFVTYNRDKQKIGSAFDITFLDQEEYDTFIRYKTRLETAMRQKSSEEAYNELHPTTKILNANALRK